MPSESTPAQPAPSAAAENAAVLRGEPADPSQEPLDRLEALPVTGLVSKPLTKEKLDTVLPLHFQRRFPAA